MALIEQFHVVADHFPVDSSVTNLIEGMFVKLNSSGNAVKATGASAERAIGVSGDTKSTSLSGLPSTNDSSQGAFVNRVSDSFDETRASGRVTVYHSGGKFVSNQYEAAPVLAWAVGLPLYISSNSKLTTDASTSAQIVATCTAVPAAYASGVPGIDINGSITLGNYIEFKLEI